MATVYLGEDPLLNRLVAIKVIQAHLSSNNRLMERFMVEAKTVAALRHPNIVEIFDIGVQEDRQFLIMEYIDGQSLQALCAALDGTPMPSAAAAAVICQAAEGLTTAERHGVVHRDIKPENLLINSAGVLKITDFGIAHITNEQSRTQTGAVLGSPNFMSPEQVEGLKPTPRTDIFSLGGVFYFCLTGKMPFTGSNIPATLRNICEKPPPAISQLNPEADPFLVELTGTLLQKDPTGRGEGARELARQLRDWLGRRGIADPAAHLRSFVSELRLPPPDSTLSGPVPYGIGQSREGKTGGGKKSRRFRRTALWGLAAAVLASVGGGIWILERGLHPLETSPPAGGIIIPGTSDDGADPQAQFTPSRSNPLETAKSGFLWIQSAPPFATIQINGIPRGETPMTSWLELSPGKYRVELLHRLAPPFDTEITVTPGFRGRFKFKLEQ